MTPVKASALKPGNTVAIVAPASPPNSGSLESGARFLKECGFNVRFGKHTGLRTGYLAGSDEQRAEDFNSMIRDPDVRAVFCARGGYGSARIVKNIDFNALARDPKVIVGFSDITLLLAAVWRECGLIGFHGPLMASPDCSRWSYSQLYAQVTHTGNEPRKWPTPPSASIPAFHGHSHQSCTGRLFGGCLSLLATLAGTPWAISPETTILFLEDIGEAPYRIDRMLMHLYLAGWFDSITTVLAGHFTRCIQRADDDEPTPDTHAVIREFMAKRHVYLMTSLPFGHHTDTLTIPFGGLIQAGPDGVTQLEPGVVR